MITVTTDFEGEEVDFTLNPDSRLITADWPVGFTRVDYSVTDECGNDSSIYFTVYVVDNQDPIFDPNTFANVMVNNDDGDCGAFVEFTYPAITDNCGVDSLIVDYVFDTGELDDDGMSILVTVFSEIFTGEDATGEQEGSFPFDVGATTISLRAVDVNGNDEELTFTVTVNDNEAPVFECPGSFNIYLDADGVATFDSQVLTANGATDNCEVTDVNLEQIFPVINNPMMAQTMFDCADIGETFVMGITAVDGGGLTSAECEIALNIMDTISPVILLNGEETITLLCGDLFTETATIADNCDDNLSLEIQSDLNVNASGTYTITYNTSDDSGNEAIEVVRTVIVESGLPVDPIEISGEMNITPAGVYTYSFVDFEDIDVLNINWSYLGAGATFVSGQGTNSVQIFFSDGFTPGNLTVSLSNACAEVTATIAITDEEPECLDEITVVAIDNILDEYFANERVISSALVESARDILFQAAESIELTPNFEVELGAVFEANIGPCLTPTILTQMLDENSELERE